MRTIHVRGRAHDGWAPTGFLDDRHALITGAGVAAVLDLEALSEREVDLDGGHPPGLVARLAGVTAAAWRGDLLVVADRSGRLRRLDRARSFREVDAAALPAPFATGLQLSPSGRHLAVRLGKGVLVMETDGFRTVLDVPAPSPAGSASFVTLPSGDEVLFVSAPSYMGVAMVDCAAGRVARRFVPRSGFDFCHTGYALSPDSAWLFTVGCVWAAPTSVRVYDARPWVHGPAAPDPGLPPAPIVGLSPPTPFPLRAVFQQEGELCASGEVLAMDPTPAPDGTVACVSLVDAKYLPVPGSEEDLDLRADASPDDVDLLSTLQATCREHPSAVVVRSVDLERGAVVDRQVHGVPATESWNARALPGHRALLVNERVQIVDARARAVVDLGPSGAPVDARWNATVAADLGTVLVRSHARSR